MGYTQTQITQQLGKVILFCGTETSEYNLGAFDNIITFARAHAVDSLLVKCADGGNWWYGGIDVINLIRNACIAGGVGFIPYTYGYGDKYNAFAQEQSIATMLLNTFGYVCLDLEAEYNGRTDLCSQLVKNFSEHKGILLCSTWGDPSLQNWDNNLKTLKNTFDAFMPQEYTNYLDSTEYQLNQDGIVNMIPTIYLGNDIVGNNAYGVAVDIHGRGHSSISLWYDGYAVSNPSLVDSVVALYRNTPTTPVKQPPTPTQPKGNTTYMEQQFSDVWNFNNVKNQKDSTGIAQMCKAAFLDRKIAACYPLAQESATNDWDGKPIVYQSLSTGIHAEWSNGSGKLIDAQNTVLYTYDPKK